LRQTDQRHLRLLRRQPLATMASVLSRLSPFGLPCLVVDDGSEAATRQELEP
jgi:hypothetical protein